MNALLIDMTEYALGAYCKGEYIITEIKPPRFFEFDVRVPWMITEDSELLEKLEIYLLYSWYSDNDKSRYKTIIDEVYLPIGADKYSLKNTPFIDLMHSISHQTSLTSE